MRTSVCCAPNLISRAVAKRVTHGNPWGGGAAAHCVARMQTIVSVAQCGRDWRTRRRVRVKALDAGVMDAPVAPQ
jgi:hypothetical protein